MAGSVAFIILNDDMPVSEGFPKSLERSEDAREVPLCSTRKYGNCR